MYRVCMRSASWFEAGEFVTLDYEVHNKTDECMLMNGWILTWSSLLCL